ncbi:MAG: type II toxin-antitoxin system VapC family toxin [Candidatus Heimdallarchaeota archaeon]
MELEKPIIADTNFLSDHLAGKKTARKMHKTLLKEGHYIITTVITVSELYFGKYRRRWQETRSRKLAELIASLQIIPFSTVHAIEYGRIRAFLADSGLDIGFADTAIAAIAKKENLPILTANIRHFERIEGIEIKLYN